MKKADNDAYSFKPRPESGACCFRESKKPKGVARADPSQAGDRAINENASNFLGLIADSELEIIGLFIRNRTSSDSARSGPQKNIVALLNTMMFGPVAKQFANECFPWCTRHNI